MSADVDRKCDHRSDVCAGCATAQLTAELAEARKQIARGARIAEKAREAGEGLLNVADRMEGLEHTLADERAAHERTKAELAEASAKVRVLCSGCNGYGHSVDGAGPSGPCGACLGKGEEYVDAEEELARVRADLRAAIAREQAAKAEAAALREVIKEQLWHADHALEAFEEQAETFYRETGIMAPGKSEPLEWGNRWTDDERRTAWTEWRIKRNAEQVELWRSVIAGGAGRALAARVPLLEKTIDRVAEIFPQMQSTFIHGEHGSTAKFITALGLALAALDEKGTP